MSFVNALAHIANIEDHHPDLEVGYNYCRVRYSTHAIGGLSENDLICAAKIDQIATLRTRGSLAARASRGSSPVRPSAWRANARLSSALRLTAPSPRFTSQRAAVRAPARSRC